jgi:uncharacterized Zn finger protein
MIAVSHWDLKHWLWSCLGSMALIPFLILSASGQQSEQLQAQLQQLKQQYEVTTHELSNAWRLWNSRSKKTKRTEKKQNRRRSRRLSWQRSKFINFLNIQLRAKMN